MSHKQDSKPIGGFIKKKIDKEINEALEKHTKEELDASVEKALKKYPRAMRNKLRKMYYDQTKDI